MTKISRKSAIFIPVELAQAKFSRSLSRESLILFLELAALATPLTMPLEKVPGYNWLGDNRSKTRSSARQALKVCVSELVELCLKTPNGWQRLFDELILKDDVFTMRPSTLLMDLMTEPIRYGRVAFHDLMFTYRAPTIRLVCFLAAFVNRYHRMVEVNLDDMKSILGVQGKYERYSNFKSKLLDVVFKEYNTIYKKTHASFSPVRTGKGGCASSILISIEDKKEEKIEPLPTKAPNKNYLEVDQQYTKEDELKFVLQSQDKRGWILPNFSVDATLAALASLNNDASELQAMIWRRYTPQVHANPDAWLKASASIWANMIAAEKPAVHDPEVEAMLDEWLREAASRRKTPE